MRSVVLVLALLGGAGCNQQQSPPPTGGAGAPSSAEVARLAGLPVRLAVLDKRGAAEADTAPGIQSGALQRYSAGGAFATVFLFSNSGSPAVPSGPDSPAVRSHLAEATQAMVVRTLMQLAGSPDARAGSAPLPVERQPEFLVAPPDAPALRCTHATIPLAQRTTSEFTCVTGLDGQFLKLRLTASHSAADTELARRLVLRFGSDLLRSLSGPPTTRT